MRTPDESYLRQRVKKELRRRFKALRNAMPADAIAARSVAAASQAQSLSWMSQVGSVASFSSVRSEIDTTPLESALLAQGARLAFPRVDLEKNAIVLHFCERSDLEEGGFGVHEPPADAPIADELDLILVPALAVDPRGFRVGYGKGFYDQLLAEVRPRVERIAAYAFDFQLVPETPNEAHDEPVDFVITDKRAFAVNAA